MPAVVDVDVGVEKGDRLLSEIGACPLFPPGNELHHKVTIGLRAIFYVLNVSVQGEFQMLSGDGAFGPVATVSTKLGLDF